ncbi:MAG TPA: type I-U CRISPR-associated protein Csb2 [Pyrinomonadaceae bacterium]|jgi:CRISPR-associated protein Csb2
MQLIIKLKFPFGRFHGREFPPSPSRLFQALIAASHRGVYERQNVATRDGAIVWLEKLLPPLIESHQFSESGKGVINYVPNNDNSFAHNKTAKSLQAFVALEESSTIRYIWQFSDTQEDYRNAKVICKMARLVTYLGHGQDTVFVRGEISENETLETENPDRKRVIFRPQEKAGGDWTAPKMGALAVYRKRYKNFLQTGNAHNISLLNVTRQVDYVPDDTIDLTCPYALFEIRRLDDEERFYSFDGRDLRQPGAMVRHAAVEIFYPSDGNERKIKKAVRFKRTYGEDLILRKILGHELNSQGEKKAVNAPHLAFLSLPNLFPDGRVRRVLLAGFGFDATEEELFADTAKNLNGAEIKDNGQPIARLIRIEESEDDKFKFFNQFYGVSAKVWRSATPIVLSGFNRRGRKPEQLLYRALNQIGIETEAIESVAVFRAPIVPKTFRPMDYQVADYLNENPRYHAEIIFKRPVRGILVIGRGRHSGFGLMMPID